MRRYPLLFCQYYSFLRKGVLFNASCCIFITTESAKTSAKPALEPGMDYERIDWQASYKSIIARIIEQGKPEHWEELINFYAFEVQE
jgi:hypothetical protein